MITPEISKYAKDELAKGTSPESLRNSLSSSGWSAADIDQLLSPNPVPPPPPSTPTTSTIPASTGNDHRTLITVLLLLFVTPIGLIVMWVWSGWKAWVKLLVTLLCLIPVILAVLFMWSLTTLFLHTGAPLPNNLPSSSSPFESVSTSPGSDFMSAYRTSFITSCEATAGDNEATKQICSCVADELIAGHTTEELMEISQAAMSGTMPESVTQALQLCTSSEFVE